jgi:hypothetical protein
MATAPSTAAAPAETIAIERTITPGSFTVKVDELDSTVYENPRGEMLESEVVKMQHSLKQHGQLSSVLVARIENSALFAVVAGYTRTEAQTRNVHAPLIHKWNDEKGLKGPAEPGFLVVSNPDHRKIVREAYPEDYAKQRDKDDHKLQVFVDTTVKTQGDARLKSFVENFVRSDMSLMAEIMAIEKMISVDGRKASEIAKQIKSSEPAISQMRKVGRLPAYLRELLVTPDKGEVIAEAELTKIKEDTKVLVDELERRLGLKKNEEQAVSFSHVREFAARIIVKEPKAGEPEEARDLTRVQIMELLCWLVGANEKTHKFTTTNSVGLSQQPAEQYGLFMARMKRAEQDTQKRREGKGDAATPATPPADGSATGSVEGLAKTQADANATPTTPATPTATAPVSTGNPAAPVAKADDGTTPADAPKGAAADAAAAAEENADAGLGASSIAAELVGADAANLVDDDLEPGVAPEAKVAGEKRTSVQAAPTATVKVKDANIILSMANTYAEQALELAGEAEANKNCGLLTAALGCAAFGYEVLGMTDKQKQYEDARDAYSEALELYILGLEEYATAAAKKKPAKPFDMTRPMPQLEAAADAFIADATGPTDEIPSLDGLADDDFQDEVGPSTEDLEALARETGTDGEGSEG